jgi:hypothetical protein
VVLQNGRSEVHDSRVTFRDETDLHLLHEWLHLCVSCVILLWNEFDEPCRLPARLRDLTTSLVKENIDPRLRRRL